LIHVDDLSTAKKTEFSSVAFACHKTGTHFCWQMLCIGKIARITNGVLTYLHKDHMGSASSGTSQWGGVLWREEYTPFGETILNPAANDTSKVVEWNSNI
jgi:hypothetical protein